MLFEHPSIGIGSDVPQTLLDWKPLKWIPEKPLASAATARASSLQRIRKRTKPTENYNLGPKKNRAKPPRGILEGLMERGVLQWPIALARSHLRPLHPPGLVQAPYVSRAILGGLSVRGSGF